MKIFHASTHARFARALCSLVIGAAVLLVAACAPGGTGAGTNSAAPPSQATPTPTAPSNPAQTGCPAPTRDVHWSPPPTIIVKPDQQSKPVKVKVGETFEIALPMGHKWVLSPVAGPTLRLDNPAGYGDAALQSCVWHFTAQSGGQTTLQFTMQPLCQKGMKCPHYISLVDFTVQVSG